MNDLNKAMFLPDVYGTINSFRQNLQVAYVGRLLNMVTGNTKRDLYLRHNPWLCTT